MFGKDSVAAPDSEPHHFSAGEPVSQCGSDYDTNSNVFFLLPFSFPASEIIKISEEKI
jgi:hypothetical protein